MPSDFDAYGEQAYTEMTHLLTDFENPFLLLFLKKRADVETLGMERALEIGKGMIKALKRMTHPDVSVQNRTNSQIVELNKRASRIDSVIEEATLDELKRFWIEFLASDRELDLQKQVAVAEARVRQLETSVQSLQSENKTIASVNAQLLKQKRAFPAITPTLVHAKDTFLGVGSIVLVRVFPVPAWSGATKSEIQSALEQYQGGFRNIRIRFGLESFLQEVTDRACTILLEKGFLPQDFFPKFIERRNRSEKDAPEERDAAIALRKLLVQDLSQKECVSLIALLSEKQRQEALHALLETLDCIPDFKFTELLGKALGNILLPFQGASKLHLNITQTTSGGVRVMLTDLLERLKAHDSNVFGSLVRVLFQEQQMKPSEFLVDEKRFIAHAQEFFRHILEHMKDRDRECFFADIASGKGIDRDGALQVIETLRDHCADVYASVDPQYWRYAIEALSQSVAVPVLAALCTSSELSSHAYRARRIILSEYSFLSSGKDEELFTRFQKAKPDERAKMTTEILREALTSALHVVFSKEEAAEYLMMLDREPHVPFLETVFESGEESHVGEWQTLNPIIPEDTIFDRIDVWHEEMERGEINQFIVSGREDMSITIVCTARPEHARIIAKKFGKRLFPGPAQGVPVALPEFIGECSAILSADIQSGDTLFVIDKERQEEVQLWGIVRSFT